MVDGLHNGSPGKALNDSHHAAFLPWVLLHSHLSCVLPPVVGGFLSLYLIFLYFPHLTSENPHECCLATSHPCCPLAGPYHLICLVHSVTQEQNAETVPGEVGVFPGVVAGIVVVAVGTLGTAGNIAETAGSVGIAEAHYHSLGLAAGNCTGW